MVPYIMIFFMINGQVEYHEANYSTSITRALSSTKPSAHCMVLATHFSIACRKGGKGLGERLL